MSMFGDGSDGALNVSSGTHNLPLNTKCQFTTVDIAAGATLSTASTTGAVLYILAREKIVIDGTINLSGKVNPGNATWPVTIDGISYSSPGVAGGGYWTTTGQSGTGDGTGGDGLGYGSASGGIAGLAGTPPAGGASAIAARNFANKGDQFVNGKNGSKSGGGSGSAWAYVDPLATSGTSATATSGAGASTHGAAGGNGSGAGTDGSSSTGGWGWFAAGGGGGGGRAGRAGVHLVLRAPEIVINGQIVTAGSNGGNGGNGGRSRSHAGWEDWWGYPGAGGGGGNGGYVWVAFASSLLNTGTQSRTGGTGGVGGKGGPGFVEYNINGGYGVAGGYGATRITDPSLYATDISNVGGIASQAATGDATISLGFLDINDLGGIASVLAFGSTRVASNLTSVGGGIVPISEVGGLDIEQSPPPPPPDPSWTALGKEEEKVYVYRVYDAAGDYIGVWADVKDTPQWTQRINTPGTTTTVQLGRSANSLKERRDTITTQDDEWLVTQDGEELISVYETPNSVGESTDVDLNYNVDIYVHYGEFTELATQDDEWLVTQDGEELLVAYGAPVGRRVFSGFILDYESKYGEEVGVTVTLASHGWELSNELVRSGETTTVTYSSKLVENSLRDVLDTNPGVMTYSGESVSGTGVSATLTFELNSKLEAISMIYDQTPDDWYWYGNVAENVVYLKPASTTPDHVFILGRHIKSLAVRRSIESLKNVVYFVGAEMTEGVPSSAKFKKYVDNPSLTEWRRGLERIVDRRYKVDSSMARRANKVLSNYSQPIFTSPLTISAAKYDIESIKLGQMVTFSAFGNFIDELPPLQIVSISYAATQVTVELGQIQKRQVDSLSDLDEKLAVESRASLPTLPS